jgi:asparagine synthase (glutamine-hydrolysing)
MCGIAGVIGARPDRTRTQRTLAVMEHRGPDSADIAELAMGDVPVTLLFRRLSIIDLDHRSDQPFRKGDCTLVYNGEIYNYVEVRAELEALGHSFRTTSDTEVLLTSYLEWGDACVERLEGMWAFVLLDEARRRVLLSRDRFGEKPLYTMWHDGALWFGSHISFLAALSGHKPPVDEDQLARYLVNGYKALYKQPSTWHLGVEELPPASNAVLTAAEPLQPKTYWSLAYDPRPMSEAEALAATRERLFDAVRIRLRADVPIAICLSGGVDSSALASIAAAGLGQPTHAFSIIDRDPRYDELDNIRETVAHLGIEHHTIESSTAGFFDRLDDLVAWRTAPVATLTYYLHSFLSEAISDAGYRVAISGTAADELFTGYYDHYAFWLAEMHGRPEFDRLVEDWRGSYGAFVRNPKLQDPLVFVRDPDERGHIFLDADVFASMLTRPFAEPFAESTYSANLLRNRMLNELRHEAVPVILHEDDFNSMRYSVENRSPYLDRRLAELLYTVPAEHLIKDGYAKWLLRASVEGLLQDSVRLDKRKRGFNAPIDSLVDRRDPDTVARLLDDGPIFDFVRREALTEFVRGDLSDNSFSKFLFSFVSAKSFLEHQRTWIP